MKRLFIFSLLISFYYSSSSQQCRFEKTDGKESATYFEAVDWYKQLDKQSTIVSVKEMGMTDAGYPLHLVLVSADGKFDPAQWHKQHKVVIMVNNGIHPGEPDGIDASMMLVRDIVTKKVKLPANVCLGLIPVYNIGGCLNRNAFSRVNQNGPREYGFRGNSQNLDLNRDFTKCDSKDAKAFTQIFHLLNPDILIDNHVSDGADFQHTMTLITTQYDKLGGSLGKWLREIFEPQLYAGMAEKKWEMIPYVDFSNTDPKGSMEMFYDPPRYSSGYAAMFQTMSFMPETHMLKPYKDRVLSTYALMQTFIEKASGNAEQIFAQRLAQQIRSQLDLYKEGTMPLSWSLDTTQYSPITFKGYEQSFKASDATGLQRMFYDHNKPFSKQIKYYNVYKPSNFVELPRSYIIPQGWSAVVDLMKLNGVVVKQLKKDTIMEVEAYHIDDYRSGTRPFEKHHRNNSVKLSTMKQNIRFLKGDYIIELNQASNRYIAEMLEPTADDSFFSWNFFDAILQQKEGYSDYRWEDVAAEVLAKDPVLKQKLADKKATDPKFAASGPAQLDFIYKNSPYYEPSHNRYPVYRLMR